MINMHGCKTYGNDKKAMLLKCLMPQFKCVAVMDIENLLRNMKRNKKRNDWSSCVIEESEEQNVNIDIFRKCMKDRIRDIDYCMRQRLFIILHNMYHRLLIV